MKEKYDSKQKNFVIESMVSYSKKMLTDLIKGTAKIIKIPKPILTDKEKEYLSLVIKPFRDRVSSISKDGPLEYITISLDGDDFAILPNFEEGTMYKGMETNRRYTLEELGL